MDTRKCFSKHYTCVRSKKWKCAWTSGSIAAVIQDIRNTTEKNKEEAVEEKEDKGYSINVTTMT